MIRRICLYGGPGASKSTLAAQIFAKLKQFGYDVELVTEYIKLWAYEGRKVDNWDQLHVFSEQLKSEKVLLGNVQYVITDSPLLMNTAYSKFHNFDVSPYLTEMAIQFEQDFPSLNLFIDRTVPYVQKGRFHTEEQARNFDLFLQDFLELTLKTELHHVQVNELDKIIDLIERTTDV